MTMLQYTDYGLMRDGKLLLNDPFPCADSGTCVRTAEPLYWRIDRGLPLRWRYDLQDLQVGESVFVPRYNLRPGLVSIAAYGWKKWRKEFHVTCDRKLKRGFYVVRVK